MKFYGQWKPPEDEVAYRNYFQDTPNGYYIECGAGNWGGACKFFAESLGWKGLNIEASPKRFENLKKTRKGEINLYMGLSNISGYATFVDVLSRSGKGADNGSFSHGDTLREILDGYDCLYEEIVTEVWRYDKLINELHALGHIQHVDYFSLDVEGHELQVLEGMEKAVLLPDVMCVEYPVVGFENVKNAMEKLGYNYNFVSHNNAFFSFEKREEWWGTTERMSDI